MFIGYTDWIINYNKNWRAFEAQIWRKEFGPFIRTKTLPSASIWLVPGTQNGDD